MYKTYVAFYRTVGRRTLRDHLYHLGLRLFMGKRYRYHHVALVVDYGDETLVYSMCDDGLDVFNLDVLNKRDRIDLVPVYFDTDVLDNICFFLRDTGYRLLVSDFLRALILRRPTKQMVCTDFVNLVTCQDEYIGYKNNKLPEVPDALYQRLTTQHQRHTKN